MRFLHRQQTGRATSSIELFAPLPDSEVIYNNGAAITDMPGNPKKAPDGRRFGQNPFYASEYSLGKTCSIRYRVTFPGGKEDEVEENFRVVAREGITVPAGTFHALRIEPTGHRIRDPVTLKRSYRVAPGTIARPIAHELISRETLHK